MGHNIFTGLILVIALTLSASSLFSQSPPGPKDQDLEEIGKAWIEEVEGTPRAQNKPADQSEKKEQGSGSEEDQTVDAGRQFFAPPSQEAPSFLSVVVRFLLMMGIMVGGLYFVLAYMRKKQGITTGHSGPVEVLFSTPLMPGRYIQVVDLAGRLLVLGVSEQGIRLIQSLEEGPTADKIRLWHSSRPRGTESAGFLDNLTGWIKGAEFRFWATEGKRKEAAPSFRRDLQMAVNPGAPEPEENDSEAIAELLKKQKKRISKMKKGSGRSSAKDNEEHLQDDD